MRAPTLGTAFVRRAADMGAEERAFCSAGKDLEARQDKTSDEAQHQAKSHKGKTLNLCNF